MAKKLTYAEIAEKLTQSYNKYDKQLQNAVTEAEKNSATRMLRRVSERMNGLVLENQDAANQQDMKKQAPDSPNLSIGTRTANGYAFGGLSPIPGSNKGLPKLPKSVRNKMGYMQSGGQTLPEGVTEKDGVYYFSERVMDGSTYAFFKSLGGLDGVSQGKIVMPSDTDPRAFMDVNDILKEIKQDEEDKKLQEQAALELRRKKAREKMLSRPETVRDNTSIPMPILKDPFGQENAALNMPSITPVNTPTAEETVPSTATAPSTTNGLYDGVTPGDFEDLMTKARAISGISDFDATNPEHVKALQTAMLNRSGESSMFSGQEGDILNDGGVRSVNNAGVDGKFGIDTLTALRQQGLSELTPKGIQPFNVPINATLPDIIQPPTSVPDATNVTAVDKVKGQGLKKGLKGLGNKLPGALAGLSKAKEYFDRASAISDMQAPAPKNLEDPVYLNTQYNIAPQINAAEEQTALLARGLNANSTKRNNVRNNLAGLAAGNQRTFNQLYADKFNKESQLQNMQTMANAKANQLNNNIIFDNENALLDFNNQKRDAKARFSSAITADAMDLLTQRTNRKSQEAALEALKPSWNKYGVMDRQYQDNGQNTELLRLLGLIK